MVNYEHNFPRRLAALYHLLLRSYFRRIWVIQEFTVATVPTIQCEKDMAHWDDLDLAAYHLVDILHRGHSMAEQMMQVDPLWKAFQTASFLSFGGRHVFDIFAPAVEIHFHSPMIEHGSKTIL